MHTVFSFSPPIDSPPVPYQLPNCTTCPPLFHRYFMIVGASSEGRSGVIITSRYRRFLHIQRSTLPEHRCRHPYPVRCCRHNCTFPASPLTTYLFQINVLCSILSVFLPFCVSVCFLSRLKEDCLITIAKDYEVKFSNIL